VAEALAAKARALLRRAESGVLSSWSQEMAGFPFGSLAPFVLTLEAAPLLYVSRLAEHTRNVAADPRVCLTVVERAFGDPQAVGRASLLGEARPVAAAERCAAAARYFALLPQQRAYEQLGDFDFWRIEPVRVRWIGGFGEIRWIEPEGWRLATPAWAAAEASIVAHMNEDHRDALAAICRRALGAGVGGAEGPDADDVAMLACDPEGFHVRTGRGVQWIPFERPCSEAEQVRAELVRLTRAARAAAPA
jgi:putative heme iron utilization protein